jgi:cytochrome c oxidase subunit 3
MRIRYNMLRRQHHFGLEFRLWYWHFVDVVWLFLFFCVYTWGS